MSEQKRYAGTESDAKQRDENNATFQNQPEKIRFESSPTEKIDNNYITVKCFTQLKTGDGGGTHAMLWYMVRQARESIPENTST